MLSSGEPDEEVYLYDADGQASWSARRAIRRVHGRSACSIVRKRNCSSTVTGCVDSDTRSSRKHPRTNHWLAGSVPGWDDLDDNPSTYQPRYLSDSGRLFFDSPDALVPQDTNGLEDVYELSPRVKVRCSSGDALG